VCEPPGDPYYLGRIMEFRFQETDNQATPVEGIRINWVYRPRDVQRFSNDTRLVYATMHSDVCPLTSLRGKCRIVHRADIANLDEYRKHPDSFWFNQCFDRFIHRWYEVVPVKQVINVPENVKKALDERWKFVVVESSRVKELTSAVKSCKRCAGYCASNDSVECAVCHMTYHMTCVRPPLLKKPSRGFAWACGPCSRAQERKLEARRTPIIGGEVATDADEDELPEEEEEEPGTGAATTAPSPKEVEDRPATEAEIAHAKMWPMRYLGIHCRVEDALQYDDRAIYPRASSRLGVKHQANVLPWYGRRVELVKPVEIKKKYIKNTTGKKDTKLTKETIAAIEADKAERAKRPKWKQDEPPGYVHRGDEHPNKDPHCTAKLLFKLPPQGVHSERGLDDNPVPPEEIVDVYMVRAKSVAKTLGVPEYSTDFLDRAIHLLHEKHFDADSAIKELKKTEVVGCWPRSRLEIRRDLREPRFVLRKDEVKRFEEGVQKYGSELRLVRLHVKTVPHADIVRFWYYWKKTDQGRKIWGSYGGRKNTKKKAETEAASKLLDDIADDQDDSAFDNQKVFQKNRKMICKFCSARKSRCWRRAPGVTPGQSVPGDGRSREKYDKLLLALCQRCARLWRKYAIKWEDQDEIAKKISQAGGRAWKRRVDEELLKEWQLAQQEMSAPDFDEFLQPTPPAAEPPRKKSKVTSANDTGTATPTAPLEPAPAAKKRQTPAPPPPPPREPTPPPPIIPNQPKMRLFPCAICECFELPSPEGHPLLTCRGCRLTVHKSCYGVESSRVNGSKGDKFWCDMCWNDGLQTGASLPAPWAASSSEPASYVSFCMGYRTYKRLTLLGLQMRFMPCRSHRSRPR
jgi:BAH domain/PHD-finger